VNGNFSDFKKDVFYEIFKKSTHKQIGMTEKYG